MTATSRLRLQRLLPQLCIACLLLVAQSAAGHRVGRKLQQTKRHTLNLAWTVRGSCSSSFLKNATYDFELAVAQASLDDLKRAVPAGNVVFMDYGNTARGGTSCKDLQVVSWSGPTMMIDTIAIATTLLRLHVVSVLLAHNCSITIWFSSIGYPDHQGGRQWAFELLQLPFSFCLCTNHWHSLSQP